MEGRELGLSLESLEMSFSKEAAIHEQKTAKKEKAKLEQQKERMAKREARAKAMSTIPGLKDDVLRLKEMYLMSCRLDWQGFEEAVKKTHFNLLYSGLNSYHECLQYVENVIEFCSRFWFEARTFADAVFGFFLTYIVYHIQPVKDDVKIRIGYENLQKMTKFIIVCQSTKNIEAEFILVKMVFIDQCFEFTENPQRVGLETKNVMESVPLPYTLPSKIVSLSHQFDTALANYKRIRDAVFEEDPSLPPSGRGRDLDYHFVSDFVKAPSSSFAKKLKVEITQKDNIDPSLHASGRDMDHNFVSDFVETPSSSFGEKPKAAETHKDDIGQRRRALRERAYWSNPESASKYTSEQQGKPSGNVNDDESKSSDDNSDSSDDNSESSDENSESSDDNSESSDDEECLVTIDSDDEECLVTIDSDDEECLVTIDSDDEECLVTTDSDDEECLVTIDSDDEECPVTIDHYKIPDDTEMPKIQESNPTINPELKKSKPVLWQSMPIISSEDSM